MTSMTSLSSWDDITRRSTSCHGVTTFLPRQKEESPLVGIKGHSAWQYSSSRWDMAYCICSMSMAFYAEWWQSSKWNKTNNLPGKNGAPGRILCTDLAYLAYTPNILFCYVQLLRCWILASKCITHRLLSAPSEKKNNQQTSPSSTVWIWTG